MKKTLKATISVAVAAIVSLSCLAVTACGGGDDFGSQEYEAFDPDKQYQLDFLGWGSVAEQRNFQYMINQFMKDNPNVKVFYNAISDTTTYSQNLINRANNLPDVFYVPDWDYIKWADSGRLVDFEKYLDDDEINQMWQKSIDIFRYDEATKTVGTGDKIYGLPKDLGPLALVYNKDLMEKLIDDYKLDVELPSATEPMTFTEFTAYLENFKGLKVDKDTVIPLAYYDVQAAVYSNNADFYTDDSATTSAINSDNFIDAIQFVADLSTKGLAAEYSEAASGSSFSKFASNTYLFTWMGPWDIATFWEGLSFEFDVIPAPKGDAEGARSCAPIGTVAYGVSAASKNKAAAVKLAKYLACSEECAKYNYKLGQAMPNIKDMAKTDWINNVELTGVKQYPQSKQVFVSVVDDETDDNIYGKSRPYYYTYDKTAYNKLMDQFNSVWSGLKTAREVITGYASTYQTELTKTRNLLG